MTSLSEITGRSIFDASASGWTRYEVTIELTSRLCGGAPSDPELVEGWLKRNLGITNEEQIKAWTLRHLSEVHGLDPRNVSDAAIEEAVKEGAIEKRAQVFKRTAQGEPYIEGRHLKAMLKEAVSIAFPQGAHKWGRYANAKGQTVGGKAPRSLAAEKLYVPEAEYVVGEDVSGVDLAVGHISDFRAETGKRSTIGYFEYVAAGARLAWVIEVLDDFLTLDEWARIWTTAERNGLGARRSQGCGQFVVVGWESA